MTALVYEGPGRKIGTDVPDAVLRDDTDAVVRVAGSRSVALTFVSSEVTCLR
jgi:hypothetical protein